MVSEIREIGELGSSRAWMKSGGKPPHFQIVSRASASGGRICGVVWGESRRPSWRGRQSWVVQAGEWAALVQVASCAACSELTGIAGVRWVAGRAAWAQVVTC